MVIRVFYLGLKKCLQMVCKSKGSVRTCVGQNDGRVITVKHSRFQSFTIDLVKA